MNNLIFDDKLEKIEMFCKNLQECINGLLKELSDYKELRTFSGNKLKQSDWDKYPPALGEKEIEDILGISRTSAYNLLNSGQFHTVRVGRMIKVSKTIFLKWLEKEK